MNLTDVLSPDKIRLRVHVSSKAELLDMLIDILVESKELTDRRAARQAVFEREEKLSTGVGHGIALPHAKTDAVRATTAALVTCAYAIDYDALDNKPVDIAILLLGPPADVRTHLQLLGRISRLINTESGREAFRTALLSAPNSIEAYRALHRLADSIPNT
ncbi:MAG: PTS sugar transporter subunit IIA [Candidatus Kapaibacterium sp.]|nr:MAG: PTS sugar transporter subunit IIA [Candidatus Kapabacteria bacterium]